MISDSLAPMSNSAPPTLLGRRQRLHAYRWFFAFAGTVLGLDQLTKLLIIWTLPLNTYGPPGHIAIVPGFFNLVHVGNTGAAWSLFSGRSTLLALLAVTTLVAIFFWRRSLGLRLLPVQISFGLLCGGILGNLIDRVVHHHVVDFLDFHFGSYVYPTFNIADSGIFVGVLVYLWYSFRTPEEPKGQ
ncbi:signal peptidase II [Opitutaceae bacterium EW11]|nr:signal peptidase II [Opitutaceae bacterium EW11]